mmetsp:Transcript_87596/g.276903  ORF Transcript_87596/g.276903 Transcript_87596/m.276903 type:complete len:204 (-) Transcript_87596:120-731(-)
MRGGRKAVRHDREHDAPAVPDLPLQATVQLQEPLGQGRGAPGAIAAQDLGKNLHLLCRVPSVWIHCHEVPALRWILRARRVQQYKVSPHAPSGIPRSLVQRSRAYLLPARGLNGAELPPGVLLQDVAVRLAGGAGVVQDEHPQRNMRVLVGQHAGKAPGGPHGLVGLHPRLATPPAGAGGPELSLARGFHLRLERPREGHVRV